MDAPGGRQPQRTRRRRRLRGLLLVAVAAASIGIALAADASGVFEDLELSTVDTRFRIRGEEPPPRNLVLVALDENSYEELDEFPLRRSRYAQALDRIRRGGPRAIGIDIQFTEQSDDAEEDNALIEGIARAKGTVLATTESDPEERGNHTVLGGAELTDSIGAVVGSALFPLDADGVSRRAFKRLDGLPSFAYALATQANGGRAPAVRQDPTWVDFFGDAGSVREYPIAAVIKGRVPARAFKDAVVVIGATAAAQQDIQPTPFDPSTPGPEVQLTATQTYLAGTPLRRVPFGFDLALIVLLGAVPPLLSWRARRPWLVRALAVGVAAAFTVAVQLLFEGGEILLFTIPLLAFVVAFVGALAVDLVTGAFERERLYDLFSRFVPDQVVAEVVAQADQGVRLGGVARTATVMFCDLRGFTSFSEGRDPIEVIGVVNQYLGEMSEAILDHGGTLVAYMGDGIFAVFGAPLETPDHADRAVQTAREMVCERLPRFNARLREDFGVTAEFRMGIGLNTGTVISGNVGSERRLEYAAIGDTTNTAARIEGLTKGTPHQLLLADSTREALTEPLDDLIDAGEVEVRGKQGRVRLWSIEAATDPPLAEG